jgi:radical SAM protein
VFAERPLLIYWELTRACELACKHCRAEAVARRDPRELSTAEGKALLQRLTGFGQPRPRLVMTGGDPLKRPDLFELIEHARSLGFSVSITPSGTYALTETVVRRFKEIGIETMALSLDGSNAQRHDAIRAVPGSFEWTIQAARHAAAIGLPLQINTMVCGETINDLSTMVSLVQSVGSIRWSLFLLVQVGRGQALRQITHDESKWFFDWLCDITPRVPFAIKTTEAPHYRRVVLQRMAGARRQGQTASLPETLQRGFGIRDGNGIMFLSHIGDVYPSGFLPVAAGNVRDTSPVTAYRDHPLFVGLRKPEQYEGKCGYCEFRNICGGSRARAWATTGNPMGSDPLCAYEPKR